MNKIKQVYHKVRWYQFNVTSNTFICQSFTIILWNGYRHRLWSTCLLTVGILEKLFKKSKSPFSPVK